MVGTILAQRYKIISQFGNGAFGIVYLAQDLNRPGAPQCIVKQLKPLANDPHTLQVAKRLFNEEARVLETLGKDDQIPTLLAFFEQKGEFYLVQEFIAGKTLRNEIIYRRQNQILWSEDELIKLLKSILKPLVYIHNLNIIHRDLKPDNLILREQDQKIVIIDFGAVKQRLTTQFSYDKSEIAPTISSTIIIGTRGYMSTEQLQGFPTTASDVYAVGIIMIEIITETFPSSLTFDENGQILWQKQAKIKIGKNLTKILNKMITNQQKKRYKNADQVLNVLESKSKININFNLKNLINRIIILIGLLSILLIVNLINKPKLKLINYPIPDHNLSISYPETWSIQDNPNVFNQDFIKFIAPLTNNNDTFQETITLSLENLENNPLSLDEYTNQIFTEIKNNIDPNIQAPVNITFANKQGKKIIFETIENNLKLKIMQVWTMDNYQVYILTFIAQPREFNKISSTIEQMIQSFQLNYYNFEPD
jgi:eukaryotic-like serine/threonine-protein kinase